LVDEIEMYLDQHYQTEIIGSYTNDELGLTVIVARGQVTVRGTTRPMIQVIQDGGGFKYNHPNPCPSCDDWARTARCADHWETTFQENEDGRPVTADGFRPPRAIAEAYERMGLL